MIKNVSRNGVIFGECGWIEQVFCSIRRLRTGIDHLSEILDSAWAAHQICKSRVISYHYISARYNSIPSRSALCKMNFRT